MHKHYTHFLFDVLISLSIRQCLFILEKNGDRQEFKGGGGHAGTHFPMFVPRLRLIKPGQT